MEDHIRPVTTEKSTHRAVGLKYIIPTGLVIGALLFAGSMYVKQNGFTVPSLPTLDQFNAQPSPTVAAEVSKAPTEAPTPTDEPLSEEDKETVRISVLNGSGVAGAAGKAADILKDEGFTTVTTGNADEYEFTDVTVNYTEGKKAEAEAILSALQTEYTVSLGKEMDLAGKTEVEVIIGKSEASEEPDEE